MNIELKSLKITHTNLNKNKTWITSTLIHKN